MEKNNEEIKNEFTKNGIYDITINRNITKKYIPKNSNNYYQKQNEQQILVDEIIVPGIDNFMQTYYDILFDENRIKETILKSDIKYICEQIKKQKEQVVTLEIKDTNILDITKGDNAENNDPVNNSINEQKGVNMNDGPENRTNIKKKTEINQVETRTNEEALADPVVLENKKKEEIDHVKNETNKREQEIKKIIDDAEIESKKITWWRSFLGIFIKKYKLEVKKIRFAKDILKIYKKGAKIE